MDMRKYILSSLPNQNSGIVYDDINRYHFNYVFYTISNASKAERSTEIQKIRCINDSFGSNLNDLSRW